MWLELCDAIVSEMLVSASRGYRYWPPSELRNKKMKMEDPNETSWVHIIPKTEICVKHCIAEFQTPVPGAIKEALSMFCLILRDFHALFNQF